MKLSTGLNDYLLATGSLRAGLSGCLIRMYSGTVPADADAAIGSATLLHTYSVGGNGTGGTFDATPTGGKIVKTPAESWTGTSVATGTTTFARLILTTDDGTDSTTQRRIQLTVGTTGADLLLSNLTFTSGATRPLNSFSIESPKG